MENWERSSAAPGQRDFKFGRVVFERTLHAFKTPRLKTLYNHL